MKTLILTAALLAASTTANATLWHVDYTNCQGTGADGTVYPAVFPLNTSTPTGDTVSDRPTQIEGLPYVPMMIIRYFDRLNLTVGPDDIVKCARFTAFMEASNHE